MSDGRMNELLASEQTRDRIALIIERVISERGGGGTNARQKRALLYKLLAEVRRQPGRLAGIASAPTRNTAFPMEAAPHSSNWVLAFVPDRLDQAIQDAPWVIATRCDGGWRDADGYVVQPSGWVPLPDPQPLPTNWRPAQGEVAIAPIVGGDIDWAKWIIYVRLPDGNTDPMREPSIAATREEATALARDWALLLELPIAAASIIRLGEPHPAGGHHDV